MFVLSFLLARFGPRSMVVPGSGAVMHHGQRAPILDWWQRRIKSTWQVGQVACPMRNAVGTTWSAGGPNGKKMEDQKFRHAYLYRNLQESTSFVCIMFDTIPDVVAEYRKVCSDVSIDDFSILMH